MANVLTALAPTIFAAARIVPNELTGLLGSINRNFDDQGINLNGVLKIPVVQKATAAATPASAMSFAAGTDKTPATISITLDQAYETSWNYTAEEERQIMLAGVGQDTLSQQIQQGIRAIRNQIETFLGTRAITRMSRAYGTAGTTPFATEVKVTLPNLARILDENGVPAEDRSLIINPVAAVNVKGIDNLLKVNEAGTSELLRGGIIGLPIFGFQIKQSAGLNTHTAGTGASYVLNGGNAIGDTAIPIKTGTGTVLEGDIVTFAGDSNKYVVAKGGGVAAPGTITIQEPGLKQALADGVAMTIGATYTGNIAIHKSSMVAVVRPALQPAGPIAEQMVVTDPITGFSFLLLRVVGSGMTSWYMRVVFGEGSPNPFAGATLLG